MASHAAPARTRSPGRARCQLNYPRREQVVQVEVLPQVKEARRDYEQHYSADVLGVRGPQWTLSTAVLDSKWTHAASDERLANHLLASSFNPADIRHHRSRPRQRYDTTHYHAFTRGDAAAGWDISTELPSRRARARAQAAADAIAAHKTAQRRQHTLSPERYTSPVRREEAFAAGLRQQRTAAAAQAAALSQRYGAEGAAAMAAILAMRRPDRRYIRIRATQADLAAVAALPPITCADDEDGQQRQRQQQQ